MVKPRDKGNEGRGREFFGAVTKKYKAFVGNSKKEVREQINKRGIARRNFFLFLCWPDGNGKVRGKIIKRGRFKLEKNHYLVLKYASRDFLANRDFLAK